MTEAQMNSAGIEPNFVRMSVGVEHIDDLKADLSRALGSSGQVPAAIGTRHPKCRGEAPLEGFA